MLIGPVGVLADRQGLHVALAALCGMLLLGLVCAVMLPGVHRHAELAEAR